MSGGFVVARDNSIHGCSALGYSSILSGSGLPDTGLANADGLRFARPLLPENSQDPRAKEPLVALRGALNTGTQTPAVVLHSLAEAARSLTSADGIAIAVRTQSAVVCRARSGEIAPELGAPLNVDSGISGECLRSASVLVCDDAEKDTRVDPDVCRALGIRSIVAVPLRGPMGMAGILEAFSARAAAFGKDQIDSLRELAEVAEAAYERECRAQTVPAKPPLRQQLFAALTPKDKAIANEMFGEPSRERRYWILGGAIIALLLITGVLWLTWHEPLPDTGEKNSRAAKAVQTASASQPSIQLAPKPEAGLGRRGSSKNGVLKDAAEISRDEDAVRSPIVLARSESPLVKQKSLTSSIEAGSDAPPTVNVASSASSGVLQGLSSTPATMPALQVRISQGITQGVLIHQVQPTYPTQARAQRVAGAVDLDATIDEKGLVKSVNIVSGAPLLASAAAAAVRQWRYSPPLLNGTPIEIQKRITVVFKLP